MMLDEVGEVIGRAGALKLSSKISLHEDFKKRFMESDVPGSDVIAVTLGSGRIQNNDESMSSFADVLDDCGLFRASTIVQAYIEDGKIIQDSKFLILLTLSQLIHIRTVNTQLTIDCKQVLYINMNMMKVNLIMWEHLRLEFTTTPNRLR